MFSVNDNEIVNRDVVVADVVGNERVAELLRELSHKNLQLGIDTNQVPKGILAGGSAGTISAQKLRIFSARLAMERVANENEVSSITAGTLNFFLQQIDEVMNAKLSIVAGGKNFNRQHRILRDIEAEVWGILNTIQYMVDEIDSYDIGQEEPAVVLVGEGGDELPAGLFSSIADNANLASARGDVLACLYEAIGVEQPEELKGSIMREDFLSVSEHLRGILDSIDDYDPRYPEKFIRNLGRIIEDVVNGDIETDWATKTWGILGQLSLKNYWHNKRDEHLLMAKVYIKVVHLMVGGEIDKGRNDMLNETLEDLKVEEQRKAEERVELVKEARVKRLRSKPLNVRFAMLSMV